MVAFSKPFISNSDELSTATPARNHGMLEPVHSSGVADGGLNRDRSSGRPNSGDFNWQIHRIDDVTRLESSSGFDAHMLPSERVKVKRLSPIAERSVRDFFAARIFEKIDALASRAGKASAAPAASDLLFIMRDFATQSPADPYVDVVMALHDALRVEDFWVEVSAEQLRAARLTLEGALVWKDPPRSRVNNAIRELEDYGFDTTPFHL